MCHPLYSEIKTENHKTHSNLFEIPIITILSFATCTKKTYLWMPSWKGVALHCHKYVFTQSPTLREALAGYPFHML